MQISSKLIQDAVDELSRLPGIGKKTALRLVLHLLKQPEDQVVRLSDRLRDVRTHILFCKVCHHVSDADICNICNDRSRNQDTLCVVESIKDVMAIEQTGQYRGLYHVLGGLISPLEGIGPERLYIQDLVDRARGLAFKEMIMALNPTTEGDTTIFYISRQMKDLPVVITTLARGVAFGAELEYTDEITLARSIHTRLPYDRYLTQS